VRRALSVLHVDPERGFGGGEAQVLGLVRYLAAAGVRQAVAADPAGALAARVAAEGVPVAPLRIRNHADVLAARRLSGLLATEGYAIVHFHSARAHAMSALLGRSWAGLRVVTRRMDYAPRGGWYARWLYNRGVDAVVAISNGVRQVLIASGVAPERIHVIPSGVDADRFAASDERRAAARAAYGLADDTFAVAMVAALEDRKGHAVLLDAVAQLRDLPLQVLCAGSGTREATLIARRDALGLGDRLRFLGQVTDVPALLAAADAAVLPSLQEGLGVAALEALAAGRPVVASAVGGLPEAVGSDGILVPAGDAAALAAALRALAADRERARALGAAGRARVREQFSIAAMARRTLALYTRLSGITLHGPEQAA
jgi:glycosyltransferase involved in cell wall biosynthesis